jgi:EAL domain-containing protein (putative c-di-GMP-specific phosphodiesterase class I)
MELTESLASENIVFIPAIIRRIKAMGMITSMDDFGVGYSSLSSLKSIPFNVLKIDKSFIDDIEVSEKGRAMVRSIIELVHAMDMRTIAEGVETETQVRILVSLGLDAVQGFYFARPMEKSKFEAMLRDNPFEKGGR